MKHLEHLFKNNKLWAKSITEINPNFFSDLSKQQNPEYLWIGCADSRVPANQIIDLQPGNVFVHRNIANMVVHTDLNCLSVIQYAVEVLRVKHIIVCGHYGCGGVKAAMESNNLGLIDNWLHHIKDVARFHENKLENLSQAEKLKLLTELNVLEQVRNLCTTSILQNAWKNNHELHVHGWIYDVNNGILKNLELDEGEVKRSVYAIN